MSLYRKSQKVGLYWQYPNSDLQVLVTGKIIDVNNVDFVYKIQLSPESSELVKQNICHCVNYCDIIPANKLRSVPPVRKQE